MTCGITPAYAVNRGEAKREMSVLLGFAFLSGVITILSPCILPVLPIVLSGGAGAGKARPFGVMAGFVASFTVFTLTLSALVQAIGIPADALRIAAALIMVLFGAIMVVPGLRTRFEILASRIASRGSESRTAALASPGPTDAGPAGVVGGTAGAAAVKIRRPGFWSGIVVGLGLGLLWTPCVGPIMASVISLALTRRLDSGSVFITLAYTLGTSLPMLGVMLGGRALLSRVPALVRNAAKIQKGLGALMILVGVAVGLGWDRRFQAAVLRAFPNYGTGLTTIETSAPVKSALKSREQPIAMQASAGSVDVFSGPEIPPENGVLGDYGKALDFLTKGSWFNTEGLSPAAGQAAQGTSMPLTLQALRGRVVMVDFWTYSCVNCVRTIPYLRTWFDTYRDKGFVIVGVHTPEFEFEKSTANVARAIRDLGVSWPVVQDNDYAQWYAYRNRYWPSHYFIDAKGHVRYFHFGEGEYDVSEKVIQALLKEAGASVGGIVSKLDPRIDARTPEIYLGFDRSRGFASEVDLVAGKATDYRPARSPANGEWNLAGKWTITAQYAVSERSGTLQLGFDARNVFLVVEPEEPGGKISVFVDDLPASDTPDVKNGELGPKESRMYQLVGLSAPGPHVLRLEVKGKLRLFAFTFG